VADQPVFNPARRKARRRALDVLYESDLRELDALEVLRTKPGLAERFDDVRGVPEYAVLLVEGVAAHRDRIDELIGSYAEGWTLDRMPPVDRNLCRIAVYELLWGDDIDDAVAISEAVELAKELSTDDSPRYLNGVLGRIAEYASR